MITLCLGIPILFSKNKEWDVFTKIGSILILICLDSMYIVPILL